MIALDPESALKFYQALKPENGSTDFSRALRSSLNSFRNLRGHLDRYQLLAFFQRFSEAEDDPSSDGMMERYIAFVRGTPAVRLGAEVPEIQYTKKVRSYLGVDLERELKLLQSKMVKISDLNPSLYSARLVQLIHNLSHQTQDLIELGKSIETFENRMRGGRGSPCPVELQNTILNLMPEEVSKKIVNSDGKIILDPTHLNELNKQVRALRRSLIANVQTVSRFYSRAPV